MVRQDDPAVDAAGMAAANFSGDFPPQGSVAREPVVALPLQGADGDESGATWMYGGAAVRHDRRLIQCSCGTMPSAYCALVSNVMHHYASPMITSRFQAITAQAWAGMLAILLMMFLVDLERFAMLGQYKELSESLAHDPGALGLLVLVCLVCINVLMQMAVRTFSVKWFRVATVWLTAAYAAFFLLHQVVHVAGGEALGIHTPLDLTHHVMGIWGAWSAWRWAKDVQPKRAAGRSIRLLQSICWGL